MGEFIAATRITFRPRWGLLPASSGGSSGGSTWRRQSACELLANLTSSSLNIPLENENEAFDSSKHHGDQKLNCCNELSHLYRSSHNGMKVNIMPMKITIAHIGWVAASVSVSFASSPSMYVFIIFAHRSPCQQCYDFVAGPDVSKSAAAVEFIVYHSNFVVHYFEVKACEHWYHGLVRLFQLVTKLVNSCWRCSISLMLAGHFWVSYPSVFHFLPKYNFIEALQISCSKLTVSIKYMKQLNRFGTMCSSLSSFLYHIKLAQLRK